MKFAIVIALLSITACSGILVAWWRLRRSIRRQDVHGRWRSSTSLPATIPNPRVASRNTSSLATNDPSRALRVGICTSCLREGAVNTYGVCERCDFRSPVNAHPPSLQELRDDEFMKQDGTYYTECIMCGFMSKGHTRAVMISDLRLHMKQVHGIEPKTPA